AAVEGLDPPRDATQPESPLNPASEPAEQVENDDPVKAQEPPDPARGYVANILGAVAALSRVPADADFDRMAAIIAPLERERRGKDLDTATGIVRRLRIALLRFDVEPGDTAGA